MREEPQEFVGRNGLAGAVGLLVLHAGLARLGHDHVVVRLAVLRQVERGDHGMMELEKLLARQLDGIEGESVRLSDAQN